MVIVCNFLLMLRFPCGDYSDGSVSVGINDNNDKTFTYIANNKITILVLGRVLLVIYLDSMRI